MSISASSPLEIVAILERDDLRDATVEALRGMGHAVRGVGRAEALAGGLDALSRRIRPRGAGAGLLTLDPLALQLRGPQAAVNVSNHECALLLAFVAADIRSRRRKSR